jgi:hypothetical protein
MDPTKNCEAALHGAATQILQEVKSEFSASQLSKQAVNAWHFEAPQLTQEFADSLIQAQTTLRIDTSCHFEPPGFTQDFAREYLDLSEWEGNERLMFDYLIGTNNTGFLPAVVQDELRDLEKIGWRFIASASDDAHKKFLADVAAWKEKRSQQQHPNPNSATPTIDSSVSNDEKPKQLAEPTTKRVAKKQERAISLHREASDDWREDIERTNARDAMLEGHGRTILAYLLNGRGGCREFLHRVTERIFPNPIHGRIIHAIRDVFDQGDEVNFVTVSNRLDEMKALASCGGLGGIVEISNATTGLELAEAALESLLEVYREREALKIGKQLQSGEISAEEATAALDLLHKRDDARLSFRSPSEILALPRNPCANFFGDRLLGVALSLVVAGIGGIGKSRLLLQLLVAFILERLWCGIETHHTKAKRWLLIQTQNSNERLQDDLNALKKYAGERDWPLVDKNLITHTLENERDLLLHLSNPENRRLLAETIRDYDPIGVVWDPLNEVGIGDLNKDVDMTTTCQAIGEVSRAGNPLRAIIVLTHAVTGQAGMKKAFGFEAAGFARNSKVLQTWARAVINVIPATEDFTVLVLTCGKNNNGKMFAPLAVRLNVDTMLYEPDPDFDIEGFREGLEKPKGRETYDPKIVAEIDWPKAELDRSQLRDAVMEELDCHWATAYRLIKTALAKRWIHFNKTTEIYTKKR